MYWMGTYARVSGVYARTYARGAAELRVHRIRTGYQQVITYPQDIHSYTLYIQIVERPSLLAYAFWLYRPRGAGGTGGLSLRDIQGSHFLAEMLVI